MARLERVKGADFFSSEQQGETKYEVSHVIGKGSYGTVCAAREKQSSTKVAIKHIDRVFADKADTVRIIRELRFLRVLKHPNVRPPPPRPACGARTTLRGRWVAGAGARAD